MRIEKAPCHSLNHTLPSFSVPDLLFYVVEGKPRFSFEQTIWLANDKGMDWNGDSLAQRTLSANILSLFVESMSPEAFENDLPTSFSALIDDFVEDVILTMPAQGGRMPADVLSDWVSDKVGTFAP